MLNNLQKAWDAEKTGIPGSLAGPSRWWQKQQQPLCAAHQARSKPHSGQWVRDHRDRSHLCSWGWPGGCSHPPNHTVGPVTALAANLPADFPAQCLGPGSYSRPRILCLPSGDTQANGKTKPCKGRILQSHPGYNWEHLVASRRTRGR